MTSSSLFLNLPLELRAQIYEYVALDEGINLHPQTGGSPISWTPLSLTCRQLHDEYKDVLYASAPTVTGYVRDFDFTHLIAFLDNLDNRLETRKSNNAPSSMRRDLRIVLILTPSSPSPARNNLKLLQQWVLRFCRQNDNRYITSFTSKYLVHRGSIDGEVEAIAPVTLMRIIDEIYCGWFLNTLPGPLKEELRKVCDCLGALEMEINRRRSSLPSRTSEENTTH